MPHWMTGASSAVEPLRAGISTFDLSRYMGASLTMIDRHYGHLARDGRGHAVDLLDSYSQPADPDVHQVDVAWTLQERAIATAATRKSLEPDRVSRGPRNQDAVLGRGDPPLSCRDRGSTPRSCSSVASGWRWRAAVRSRMSPTI